MATLGERALPDDGAKRNRSAVKSRIKELQSLESHICSSRAGSFCRCTPRIHPAVSNWKPSRALSGERSAIKLARLSLFLCLSLLALASAQPSRADSPSAKRKPDVWYVATSAEIVDRMVDVARVRPGDVVYDLGCGDGRMVIAAAKKFGTRGVGVDIDPDLVRVARANAKAQGVDDLVTFKVEDLFDTDLREATVVMMYLLPEVNRRLKPKLFAELRPGARVVSHNWDMGPSWPPDREMHLGHEAIYLWVMPNPSAALAEH